MVKNHKNKKSNSRYTNLKYNSQENQKFTNELD